MAPGSADAGGGEKEVDTDMDEEKRQAAVAVLQPGDMVFAKFARYPYWPATITPCDQRGKNKNAFIIAHPKNPLKSKFWVSFFNENSGAFILASNIVPFAPALVKHPKYQAGKFSAHHEKHRVAMKMATEDYYSFHPELSQGSDVLSAIADDDEERGGDGDGDADGDAVMGGGDSEEEKVEKKPKAKVKVKREKKEPASSGRPAKRRKTSVESGNPQADDDENTSARQEGSGEDEAGDADAFDSDEEKPLVTPKTKKKKKTKTAKSSDKPLAKSKSRKKSDSKSADSAKLQAALRENKHLKADLKAKSAMLEEASNRVAKLEHKVEKLKSRSGGKVKVAIPDSPSELPANVPPAAQQGQTKMSPEALKNLVADCSDQFKKYESNVVASVKADEKMEEEARVACEKVQTYYEAFGSATKSVLDAELNMAELLRALYKAKLSPADIVECGAGKVVKRIARRTSANSKLICTLAEAVSSAWVETIEKHCESGGTPEDAVKTSPTSSAKIPSKHDASVKKEKEEGSERGADSENAEDVSTAVTDGEKSGAKRVKNEGARNEEVAKGEAKMEKPSVEDDASDDEAKDDAEEDEAKDSPASNSPAPDSPAPDSPAPDSPAHSPAPHSPAPHSPAPNSPAPHSPAPHSPAPNSPAPDSPAPDSPAPDSPARDAKDSPPPAAKDSPEPAGKDSPPPAAKDSSVPAAKDSQEPAVKDSPPPAAKDSPEPAAKDSPEPAAKDSPEPALKDSPPPAVKESRPPVANSPVPESKDSPTEETAEKEKNKSDKSLIKAREDSEQPATAAVAKGVDGEEGADAKMLDAEIEVEGRAKCEGDGTAERKGDGATEGGDEEMEE